MNAAFISPCACGAEPPGVWAYSHHSHGATRWHVFCKVCFALVVRNRKREALAAWRIQSSTHPTKEGKAA